MFHSAKILGTLVAILALSVAAGCANQASPPPPPAAASGPELAGAWYQIYFDTNSVEINARGQTIIKKVAYVVTNAGPTRVTVMGRTDRVGAPPDNTALAHRRANAVRDALITAGVPAADIDTSWAAEGTQTGATADDAAEPRNRVVDITVVKLQP